MFQIKKLGEYQDLYLKTDVLLLCDLFEKFIKVSVKHYGLYLCHYFSSPGLSRDAMLQMTGIQLEKISNIDIHLFLGKGREVVLVIFQKDTVKAMIIPKLCIEMQIIYMVWP